MKKRKKENRKKRNKQKGTGATIKFPARLVRPIAKFLSFEIKKLEKRKNNLETADPFKDTSRVIDNAASDSEANEQIGHARVTALKGQVDRRLIQIKKALARIKLGKYGLCEECSQMIDTDRLMIMPEATVCIRCQKGKGQSEKK